MTDHSNTGKRKPPQGFWWLLFSLNLSQIVIAALLNVDAGTRAWIFFEVIFVSTLINHFKKRLG